VCAVKLLLGHAELLLFNKWQINKPVRLLASAGHENRKAAPRLESEERLNWSCLLNLCAAPVTSA
jgi:hypothetical protein